MSNKYFKSVFICMIIALAFINVVYAKEIDENPFLEADKKYDRIVENAKEKPSEKASLLMASEENEKKAEAVLEDFDKQYIVKFKQDISLQQIHKLVNGCKYKLIGKSNWRTFVLELNNLNDFKQKVEGLIEYIEKNQQIKLDAVPSDTYYSEQWALPALNLPQAWDITKGSNTVYVAVIDSGIYREHPDLIGVDVKPGYDFYKDTTCNQDYYGHGTAVTGVIAAQTNNAKGIAGVNWNVAIFPYSVLGYDGYGTADKITDAIRKAADSGCDVINLSLSGENYSSAYDDAISYATSKGCIVVAAAGNDGKSGYAYRYPASCNGVISVASVDSDLKYSSFSQYNDKVDVGAPGENILTTTYWEYDTYNYAYVSGTSLSAPYVAGIAALVKAYKPSITPAEFTELIKISCTDLGDMGYDVHYGYGLIDAQKMLLNVDALDFNYTIVDNKAKITKY